MSFAGGTVAATVNPAIPQIFLHQSCQPSYPNGIAESPERPDRIRLGSRGRSHATGSMKLRTVSLTFCAVVPNTEILTVNVRNMNGQTQKSTVNDRNMNGQTQKSTVNVRNMNGQTQKSTVNVRNINGQRQKYERSNKEISTVTC